MYPPKTRDEIQPFVERVDRYYRNSILGFEEDNKFYEGALDDYVKVPKGYHKNIPTTGRAVIDEAVDNVEPYDIRIAYPARGPSEKAAKEAEIISRFLRSVIEYWRVNSSDIDVLRDFIKNLFKHGKAVLKIVPDYTLWPSIPDDEIEDLKLKNPSKLKERIRQIKNIRASSFPLVCRSISPVHIMEDPSVDSRKLWVVEKYQMTTEDVRRRFEKYIDTDSIWENDTYTIYEIWTATYSDDNGNTHFGKHWIYFREDVVLEEDNPYDFLPYIIKYSGFGADNQDGKAEHKAMGFYTIQVKSMLAAELRRFTHFDAMLQQLAFPIIFLPQDIEDLNPDVTPGGLNFVPMEVMEITKNIFIKADLPDAEYMQSLSIIQGQIERGTTQRALRGAGVPGTDSAAQLQMVTAQAKLRVEPLKKVCEGAIDNACELILRYIVDVFEEPLSIFAAEKEAVSEWTVSPRMIGRKFRTKTTFMPSEEQIKERKILVAAEAMAKAQLNPYDAYKLAGFDDATEIIERNLAFEMLQEPQVRRAIAKRALEKWGYSTLELMIETMQDDMMAQQILAALQARLAGQMQPGTDVPGQMPQGPQGMPPQGAQAGALPQAAGAPIQGLNTPPDISGIMQGGGLSV